MKLRRVWVILGNGLQLFDYAVTYCRHCGKVLLNAACVNCQRPGEPERWALGDETPNEKMLSSSIISTFLSFFESRFDQKFQHFTLGKFSEKDPAKVEAIYLFVQYREVITHYEEGITIQYWVLVAADRDKTMPVETEIKPLVDLCRVISLDFYREFSDELATYTPPNLTAFRRFESQCKTAILRLPHIADELEKRLQEMKTQKQDPKVGSL